MCDFPFALRRNFCSFNIPKVIAINFVPSTQMSVRSTNMKASIVYLTPQFQILREDFLEGAFRNCSALQTCQFPTKIQVKHLHFIKKSITDGMKVVYKYHQWLQMTIVACLRDHE